MDSEIEYFHVHQFPLVSMEIHVKKHEKGNAEELTDQGWILT